MQKRPKTDAKRMTGPGLAPAKPPRLKAAAKKQLQFESPLPRRTRAQDPQKQPEKVIAMPDTGQDADTDAAAEAAVDVPETGLLSRPDSTPHSVAVAGPGQRTKKRLAEGCTSLMYACQRGDIVQVLAQIRAKVRHYHTLEISKKSRSSHKKIKCGAILELPIDRRVQ